MKNNQGRGWAALLVVWVVWGSTYFAIRVAVESLPPLLMAGTRYLVAGLILFPLARRGERPSRAQWLGCALVGALLLGANGALSVAERTVPSGLASLLIATVPLWLLIMDAAVNRARFGAKPALGLAIGLAGVGLLSGTMTGSVAVAGVVTCLCAAVAWALGTVLSRRVPMPGNPVLGSAMEMITAGAVLLCISAVSGEAGSFHPAAVSGRSWPAMAYLIAVGSLIGFSAYVMAVRLLPTTTVATYAYVNPVIAVLLGATLLGERLSAATLIGGALVVGSVALVASRPAARSAAAVPGPADAEPSCVAGQPGRSLSAGYSRSRVLCTAVAPGQPAAGRRARGAGARVRGGGRVDGRPGRHRRRRPAAGARGLAGGEPERRRRTR